MSQPIKALLTDRDHRILFFLWRWKVAPTSILVSKRFFPNALPPRGYNRLQVLKRLGLIKCRVDEEIVNFAWTLTAKGYDLIAKKLPPLREHGFKSESFTHDLLSLAFHLGEFAYSVPSNVGLFSEQELRRYDLNTYLYWVPKSTFHRPDGYIGLFNESKVHTATIALEVEISRKVLSAYESVAAFYSDQEKIQRVLWLVSSIAMASRIQSKISESVSTRGSIHSFILLDHFKTLGWKAQILHGANVGFTIVDCINLIATANGCRKPVESQSSSISKILLETRKCYVRPTTWRKSSTALRTRTD